ncbi:MAG: DUF6431 domain-containing protein [Dehalobacterium sp.]
MNDSLSCGGDKREDTQISPPQRLINVPTPHHDFILAYLGQNQQEYIEMLPELERTTFYCPVCGSLTHFHQWKTRSSWSSDSGIRQIEQLRVKCTNPTCEKTHVIIPDFLQPLKRYVSAEIEFCIASAEKVETDPEADNLSITAAEDSTIKRWIVQFAKRLPEILNTLIRLLMIEYEKMMSLLDCSQGYSRLGRLIKGFPSREAATTLGRANLELFLGGSGLYF